MVNLVFIHYFSKLYKLKIVIFLIYFNFIKDFIIKIHY